MRVCHCTNACKSCGQCCQTGHLWCPLVNPTRPPHRPYITVINVYP